LPKNTLELLSFSSISENLCQSW